MTEFDHEISRVQMTRLQLVIYLVIFSNVTPEMEKITNLTMNLYILLNSNTADGFRDSFKGGSLNPSAVLLKGSLNPSVVLELSKLIYYHNST